MRVVTNLGSIAMNFGLCILAGSFLFGAGALTATGWLVALPLFLGSITCMGIGVYNLIPEKSDNKKVATDTKGEIDKKQTPDTGKLVGSPA